MLSNEDRILRFTQMELAVETMSQNLKEAIEQVRETRKVVAQTHAQLHAERGVGNGGN
jgi:hypothetical protein